MFRVGFGTDNHRLTIGRPLFIGGVEVEAPVGADAHSDGDVLLHALCDALYGAAGLGDIGDHFPDSDPQWRGQASSLFVERAAEEVAAAGYALVNLDATITLEKVKLGAAKREIARSVQRILAPFWPLSDDAINVKAKTNERCDAIGRGEAIAAQVAVLLERREG